MRTVTLSESRLPSGTLCRLILTSDCGLYEIVEESVNESGSVSRKGVILAEKDLETITKVLTEDKKTLWGRRDTDVHVPEVRKRRHTPDR